MNPGRGIEYSFGGLGIHSEIVLPGLAPLAAEHDHVSSLELRVTARQGAAPPVGVPVYRWRGRFDLSLETAGDGWLIRCTHGASIKVDPAGRTIDCQYRDEADIRYLGDVLVRRILPRLAGFHRRLVLHAATLSDGENGIMLFGASGVGKSTMTAAIARALGWDILTDDMSVISTDGRRTVWPTLPGVSLWQASQQGLALDEEYEPLWNFEGKGWRPSRPAAPARLGLMIFLSEERSPGHVEWEALSGPSVLVMAASQLVPFNPADRDEVGRMMTGLYPLLKDIPAYSLGYPRRFEALPEVLDTIRKLHADALCQTV